ncbi:MAG: DUF2997 domain-containing protein [Verrucomicrobia bacterium]|nr:DUF2997 domain-containing protein [Verrucomicrobiota bacterium]
MKPTIEIIVSPTGEFTIEGVGFKGAGCEKATRFLEEALGVVTSKEKKPEFHQQARSQQQQQLGQ